MKKVLFLIAVATSLLSCSKEVSCYIDVVNNTNKTYFYTLASQNIRSIDGGYIHKNEIKSAHTYLTKEDKNLTVVYADTLTGKMYRCVEIYTFEDCKNLDYLEFNIVN